jgi:lipopolysaccharide transport system ATP-binding protein
MSSEVVISAQGVGKCYAIFKRPEDRLKQMLAFGRRKYYSEYWALRHVNLEVRRGEAVAIIGRNGAGKSTLLQMICGTLQPTTGKVEVKGRVAALLELGAGFNPEFTGRENVYLAAAILGLSNKEIDARYDDIAEFAGIGDFIDQPVKLYSSGMYARLAFAVAAHVDADVLIVDEILSVGDAAFGQKCMRFIRKFKETGTLLFVSHDTASVTNLCDSAIWIERGELKESGQAKEVVYSYLASLYAEHDDGGEFKIGGVRKVPAVERRAVADPRRSLLSESEHRNALEIFDFDPEGVWFGQRGATIRQARLLDVEKHLLPNLAGGEEVLLEIEVEAHVPLDRPIVGFYIKDRLAQNLFGDNTYLTYRAAPISAQAGERLIGRFHFQMPYLPSGDYSINVAVANGTQTDHVQHHWIDDAMFFRVDSSHVMKGLVGVPMIDIVLETVEVADETV